MAVESSGKWVFRLASHTCPYTYNRYTCILTRGISTSHLLLQNIWEHIRASLADLNLFSMTNSDLFHNCFFPFVGDVSARSFECLCDGASCSSGDRCFSQQCFTSLSILNGTSVLQKGCIEANEKGSLRCGSPPTPELVVECCYGDLCNVNVSLQSPVKGEVFAS